MWFGYGILDGLRDVFRSERDALRRVSVETYPTRAVEMEARLVQAITEYRQQLLRDKAEVSRRLKLICRVAGGISALGSH